MSGTTSFRVTSDLSPKRSIKPHCAAAHPAEISSVERTPLALGDDDVVLERSDLGQELRPVHRELEIGLDVRFSFQSHKGQKINSVRYS